MSRERAPIRDFARRHVWPGIVLLFLAGCVQKAEDGPQSIYKFESGGIRSFGVLMLAILFCGLTLTYIARQKRQFPLRGLIAVTLSLFVLCLALPSIAEDYVRIDDEHFESSESKVFSARQHDIRFADLDRIEVSVEIIEGLRDNYKFADLICHFKNGEVVKVHLGNVQKKAVPEILDKAEARGVQIVGRENQKRL